MYTSRMHKIFLKNISTIAFKYSCKIVSAETGATDPGYFSVSPHEGTVAAGCD
jgi:hydrocephalus-inducing protein